MCMSDLADIPQEEKHAALAQLSQLLRVVPITVIEETQGQAHELRIQHHAHSP